LLLDLHANIAHLGPDKRRLNAFAPHPTEQGEHPGGARFMIGDQWLKCDTEVDNITFGLSGLALAGDGQVVEPDTALLVHMDIFQTHGQGCLSKRLVLEVGLGNPANQVCEARGLNGISGQQGTMECGIWKKLMRIVTLTRLRHSLVDGGYQRMLDGCFRPDISEKRLTLVLLFGAQFIHQDAPRHGYLLGKPGAGEGVFANQFLEVIFTKVAVIVSGIHGL
jgi:hypothetical protein